MQAEAAINARRQRLAQGVDRRALLGGERARSRLGELGAGVRAAQRLALEDLDQAFLFGRAERRVRAARAPHDPPRDGVALDRVQDLDLPRRLDAQRLAVGGEPLVRRADPALGLDPRPVRAHRLHAHKQLAADRVGDGLGRNARFAGQAFRRQRAAAPRRFQDRAVDRVAEQGH